MRFLVTGGCGFIGSEVVTQLLAAGHEVRVVDNLSKPESSIKEGYEFIKADLQQGEETLLLFEDIEVCINLAAKVGGIGYFHRHPATILSENARIYSNTFLAAAKQEIARMVYVSSSMVFEDTTTFPSREDDLKSIPPPTSAYGFSKLLGEIYCRAFHDQHGLPFTICRPFNAYGIRESPGEEVGYAHVIPDLVKKTLKGQYPLEILGDGKQTRCFTHVRDIARGIIAAAIHPKGLNQDFNISAGEETTVLGLARRIWKLCGREEKFKFRSVESFRHDVRRRIPDVSKAAELLGWKAEISLDEGLPEVVSWLGNQHGNSG